MPVQLLKPGAPPPGQDFGYCTYAKNVPEQINIQIAGPDSVVVSFVTLEEVPPVAPPVVMWSGSGGNSNTTTHGVTHAHQTPQKDRTYYMHFVRLSRLDERGVYDYVVRSGGANAETSKLFSFRAPYEPASFSLSLSFLLFFFFLVLV